MSSLRLALKQSLKESGLDSAPEPSKKKRGPGRPRKQQRQPGDPPRKRGRPRKHPLPEETERHNTNEHHHHASDEDEGDYSSENEFSEEDDNSRQARHEDEEEEDEHPADDEHDKHHHHHHHHSAASKIQSHWKKKKKGPQKQESTQQPQSSAPPQQQHQQQHQPEPSVKQQQEQQQQERSPKGRKKADETGTSGGKSKTVPPPAPEIVEWMRSLPLKRARRNVAVGLRVKVRFATKVKREGKIVRKKKWFGGRIRAVSKEGSKIRIKYDDGTAEVTKFPDKDVVVDDTFNGQHQCSAEKFLPPENDAGPDPVVSNSFSMDSTTATEQQQEPHKPKLVPSREEGVVAPKVETTEVKVDSTTTDAAPPEKPEPKKTEAPPVVPEETTPPKPKRKRGRPPKHRPPVEAPKPKESDEKMESPKEERKKQESTHAAENKTPPASKPTLTIRIPNYKKDEETNNASTPSEVVVSSNATESVREEEPAQTVAVSEKSPRPKKRELETDESTDEPPAKRLHIHIPVASKDKASLEKVGEEAAGANEPSTSHDDEARETKQETMGESEQKESSSMPSPSVQREPESSETEPAVSPRVKKPKRKRRESDESSDSKIDKNQSESQEPPAELTRSAETEPVHASSIATEASKPEEEHPGDIGSKNSAFDRKEADMVKMIETFADDSPSSGEKPTTPRGRPKQDKDAPIFRSGRRAAQQANERIASRQEMVIQDPFAKKKRKKDRFKDGDEDGSETSDDDSQWVQCDKCGKWRIIPSKVVPTLPSQWYCADNIWDKKRASCDAAEQSAKQVVKYKQKRRRKRQRLLMQQQQQQEAAAAEAPQGIEAVHSDSGKEGIMERTRSPLPREEESAKPKRSAPEGAGDSIADTQQRSEKKTSTLAKKKSVDGLTSLDEGVEVPVAPKRGRGRPRRTPIPVKEPGNVPNTSQEQDEADNLEWVQCEKCDKWRKLPPHISADELPDVWYCSMNTWNETSASCDAPEDKADGLTDIGVFGSSGSMHFGKLSYRNLIFGSNGRKANRPVSERTRAAESLFTTVSDDNEAPPTVMYANSSAFVSRSRSNVAEENEGMTFFELMSHSNLWAELKGAAQSLNGASQGFSKKHYSFDTLPGDMKESMKDLILTSLGTKTLTGDEVLLETQGRNWDNVPQGWTAVRDYCSINFVVMALCELVKEGILECVQKMGPEWTMKDWNPRYRRAKALSQAARETPQISTPNTSRCMKIAKPWKRARMQ